VETAFAAARIADLKMVAARGCRRHRVERIMTSICTEPAALRRAGAVLAGLFRPCLNPLRNLWLNP
ncbi:MAG: hypothetical protein J0H40_00040, partial [Rhizobiales bacterium]|nr:hypothetical protein [Hyphomicrobiales bacterium]